jgi:DNA-binding NtrC family response regulator
MVSESILIAETDLRTLDILPDVLSDHIPQVVIDTCTTADQLIRRLEGASYDAVSMSPMLLHTYRSLKHKAAPQIIVPLIVTVCQRDLPLAHTAFAGSAFDLIVKPIDPQDAAQTVRLALWQNKLRKLLALKERAASRVRQQGEASPHDLKAEEDFLRILEKTYQTLKTSFGLLLNIERKSSLRDVADSVERRTRQLALDRLLNMYKEGPTH